MTGTARFERYLDDFRRRLRRLAVARGTAVLAVAALAVTVVAVTLAIRRGFPAELVVASRLVLFGAIAAIAWRLIAVPARRVREDGAADIERRVPAFGGRVATWRELRGDAHPLAELLAEDSLSIARDHDPEACVPRREFSIAITAAGAAAFALLFLAIAGPGNYAYGVRHLWLGWAWPGLLPPQRIDVLPGDDGIRLGGTVRVQASMSGFDPPAATVHARFGTGEWQQVAMAGDDGRFEFTFFSVREPLEYYVSAANVRSEAFAIRVVDLPVIENLAVTYDYPEWTGRDDETEDPGGDVRAVADTKVTVTVTADRPMTPGDLVVGDVELPLEVDGASGSATFTVAADGQYYVAARVGGERIRLTDDFFVSLAEDAAPEISFARPGRDWSASSIEEVTAQVTAQDDFRIESLELRYSVNGGDWTAVPLAFEGDSAEADHVFFLESLAAAGSLVPGDLVSYYAVAGDRGQSASTDIFFIDVQPFDRRYSQSQQAGGMPGQGGQQNEISARQKEIIVSTWNLIREQKENRRNDPAYVSDNAALLARVQATLREQVATLARRTEARQLTESAEEIARFVDHLDRAAEAMGPAADRLGELDLEQAILPEQEALQHLLAAEAVFTDISVSLSANNRGGGGQAGRDLTEMFELEMDLEKNQYETGSRATPEAPAEQLEDVANELEALARRQEQLARNLERNRQATAAERWQQEMLRREAEELRQQLERMRRQDAANDELRRRVESAVRAMREADDAMQPGGNPDDVRRAAGEAGRQLGGARDAAQAERQQAMQASLDDLAERAGDLYDEQEAMENRLQRAIRGIDIGRNEFDRLDSGLSIFEEYELAREKRELQSRVQQLEQDARNTAQQIAGEEPEAAEQIRDAIDRLREEEVETRIAVAAAYIEQGEAVYVAGSESAVTEALRELEQDLERARDMAARGRGERQPGDEAEQANLARTLAETRELRRGLQRLADGDPLWAGRDDRPDSSGVYVDDIDLTREFDRSADNISADVLALFRELAAAGVPAQDLDELRRLAAEIRASEWSGNPELLEAEARRALAIAEQLELALARSARGEERVRTNAAEEIPESHREIVADYYRRLGRSSEERTP